MRLRTKIVAGLVSLAAAATIAPASAQAATTTPSPSPSASNNPCGKWVNDNDISGRNGVSVRDNVGKTHVIKKFTPQFFCPVSVYVHSGYDTYAESASYHSNYTSTGWHTLSAGLKSVSSGTLYVWER